MVSESARMSSALEARYRLQAPNSLPRNVKIIALDAVAEDVLRGLARGSWQHATFHSSSSFLRSLRPEVASADLVIMVAGPGGDADAVSVIGAACSERRVSTTALIVGVSGASDEALSRTLAQVRPWSLMVVIANTDEYIADMLTALRA
jgi:hypothetical protein